MRFSGISWIAFIALALFGSVPSHALDPEWAWKVVGQTPVFEKKSDAIAHMHSLGPLHPLLTVERRISQISEGEERYIYEAPPVAVIPDDWRYFDDLWGAPSGYLDSEEAWVAERTARQGSDSRCPATTFTPTGEWYTITANGWGGTVTREGRPYMRTWYSYPGHCLVHQGGVLAVRDRGVSCPTSYRGMQAPPGCYLPLTATIAGTRTYCEAGEDPGSRGNPCNAITGDKFETVRDYSGPHGLTFERYFHSRSSDATNGMGVGWSHNYQSKLIISNGGTLYGIVRPNGYRESFTGNNSAGYVSVNGIVVKPWQAFLSDGTVEVYNGSGRLTSIRRPNGGTTNLTYSGSQLTEVTGPFGHKLQFEYDADGRLIRVITPSSQAIEFAYTGNNLTSALYPDATSRIYHYEDVDFPHHLTGITDESSTRFATFAYDSIGRAVLTEHAGGAERYTIQYNPTNSVVTDPLGTVETINFTTHASYARRIT